MKIVAKVLLIDSSNNLLLLNRGLTHPNFPGHYDLPGGEVENGESWDVAVVREVKEEAGIKVNASQLNKVFERKYPTVLHILYVGRLDKEKPDVKLSWEHSDFRWITAKDLLGLPIPKGVDKYYLDVIQYLKSSIRPND
jgi:8-oxo-dGTP diphosphatase